MSADGNQQVRALNRSAGCGRSQGCKQEPRGGQKHKQGRRRYSAEDYWHHGWQKTVKENHQNKGFISPPCLKDPKIAFSDVAVRKAAHLSSSHAFGMQCLRPGSFRTWCSMWRPFRNKHPIYSQVCIFAVS